TPATRMARGHEGDEMIGLAQVPPCWRRRGRSQPNRVEGSDELPPPTPPGMRVRTGRFRRSRCRGTVVKVNPLLPHVGHTLLPQPLLVQGTLDDTVTRHAPVPLAAPRGQGFLPRACEILR